MSLKLFPFNHTGIPDAALLVLFCIAAALLITLSGFILWCSCCRRRSRRKNTSNYRKSAASSSELRLWATVSRETIPPQENVLHTARFRHRLSEKDARALINLDPTFNQHVLIPDPIPRNTPTSPLLQSPTYSGFSHASSSSPLLNTREHSVSDSIPPSLPSKPETLYVTNDTNTRRSSLSSFERSPNLPDVGVPMTATWEGSFKAVPVDRALVMKIRNSSLESLGLQRTRQLRLQGSVEHRNLI